MKLLASDDKLKMLFGDFTPDKKRLAKEEFEERMNKARGMLLWAHTAGRGLTHEEKKELQHIRYCTSELHRK